jgi:putative ABC transport system permease protein
VKLAFTLARRELRTGVRGLRIVLACLALGVAVIAAVGTLREAIDRGLAADGRRLLGGDLEVSGGAEPLPDELRAWLRALGARLSDVTQMRSMLVAENGERQLIALKAVDPNWPLVGTPGIDPSQTIGQALADHGLIADRVLLDRLGVRIGDKVRLGRASMVIRGALTFEPDRAASTILSGPRVIIAAAALPETGLVTLGSMVTYQLRVALPPGTDVAAIAHELGQAFAGRGWRIRNARQAASGVVRFVDQTGLFMTLVGLTALLVGGIGVATGVGSWLEARARGIATLRCLGASSRLVFAVYLIQVMALSLVGTLAGLVIGLVLPFAGIALLGDLLPVPPRFGIFPGPLLLAAAFGLLTAACFSLWPLGRAARIPGAALFRDAVLPERGRPERSIIAANVALAAALVALTVATAPDRKFAMWFCGAAALTLVLFQLGAVALAAAARLGRHLAWPAIRLGFANLYRPGAQTPLMLVSVGLGLSTLAAVALIEGNLRREVMDEMPANAPSFYFIDIQNEQMPTFQALLAATPGISEVRHLPNLRARIVAVNGTPVEQVHATPETQWALRGDRGMSYAATPPPGTRLVAGQWWPADYDGPPLVSFDAEIARGWGIGIGDTIRVNVLGRDIDLRIANLRDIAWRSLSLNFLMVASPGLLSHAPHTNIATVRVADAEQGRLLRAVTDALPNVTGIRVEDVLAAVASFLGQITAALVATGSLTLVAGALVLAGSVAAGQRRRIAEAVILKSLGATRRQIRAAWLAEFAALGASAGLIAALVGTAASYGVARWVMHISWSFLPGTLLVTILVCVALMLIFGYAGTRSALRARAAPLLRNE